MTTITEITKKILGPYISGASADSSRHARNAGEKSNSNSPKDRESASHSLSNTIKRADGIDRAVNKLSKGKETTAGNYINTANADRTDRALAAGKSDGNDTNANHKEFKRAIGIHKAVKRLTKEETTMKHLRDIIPIREAVNDDSFKPQAKGEKEFVDLHKVDKIADRNGNGDDVFNQTKVKTYSRKKMGEQPNKEDGNIKKLTALQKGVKVVATEEVETVDEISKKLARSYREKAIYGYTPKREAGINLANKKRGELSGGKPPKVKATGPDYAYGIKEEEVSELAKTTLKSYIKKGSKDCEKHDDERISRSVKANTSKLDNDRQGEEAHRSLERVASRKVENRSKGADLANRKIATEEVIQVDELSKKILGRYLHRAVDSKKEHDHARGFRDGEYVTKLDDGAKKKVLKKIDKQQKPSVKNGMKRETGVHTAIKKVTGTAKVSATEEVIQVDETSKVSKEKKNLLIPKKNRTGKTTHVNTFDLKTALTDYAHKKRVNEITDKEWEDSAEDKRVDKENGFKDGTPKDKAADKKMVKSINKAEKKLSESLADFIATKKLEELSTKKLNAYASSAAIDQDSANDDADHFTSTGQTDDANASKAQAKKRESGIDLANKKIKGSNDTKVLSTEDINILTEDKLLDNNSNLVHEPSVNKLKELVGKSKYNSVRLLHHSTHGLFAWPSENHTHDDMKKILKRDHGYDGDKSSFLELHIKPNKTSGELEHYSLKHDKDINHPVLNKIKPRDERKLSENVSPNPEDREVGSDSLVDNFKTVTPGEKTEKKKVSFNEALASIADITVKEVEIAEAKKLEDKAAIIEEAKSAPKRSMADLTSSLMKGGF
jgi:hypothetical protein